MQQHPDDIVAAMKVRIRSLKQRLAESLELATRGAILSMAGRDNVSGAAPGKLGAACRMAGLYRGFYGYDEPSVKA